MYKNATFKKVAFLFIIINLYLSDAAIMNKIASVKPVLLKLTNYPGNTIVIKK